MTRWAYTSGSEASRCGPWIRHGSPSTVWASSNLIRTLVLALSAWGLGCGDRSEAPAQSWSGEVLTLPSGGVEVRSRSGAWPPGGGWEVDETLRIGTLDGDGPDVFGRISALTVDSAGNIFVFDQDAAELRVFSADGAFLRRFGRKGSGPGEFGWVLGMSIAPDGALWLVDGQTARYTRLRGEEVETFRRASAVHRPPWLGGFLADGSFYDGVLVLPERRYVVVRVDGSGLTSDTVPIELPTFDQPRRGSMTLPLPYAPRALWAFDPRGHLWTASTHEYRLTRTTLMGDTTLIVRLDVDPPPLSAAQSDSIRSYVRTLESEFGVAVSGQMIPRSAPLLRWMVVDDRGHLWVGRTGAGPEDPIDVFDPDGRYLGNVRLPFDLVDKPVVHHPFVYGVSETVEGAPVVVKGRITE